MNVLGGGTKFHIMKYKGVIVVDGQARLDITSVGRTNKACGGRYQGQLNAVDFSKYQKSNPEWLCKKCLAIFDELISEVNKTKQGSDEKLFLLIVKQAYKEDPHFKNKYI